MSHLTILTKFIALVTALFFLLTTSLAFAATTSTPEQKKIDELLRLLQIQASQIKQQQHMLEAQNRRFLDYQQQTEELLQHQQANIVELQARLGLPVEELAEKKQTAAAAPPPTQNQRQPAEKIEPVGQPPKQEQKSHLVEATAALEQPGVLTAKGQLVLEPSLQYSHFSNNRVSLHGYTIIPAITIGLIDIYTFSRDTFITALAARYGLTNHLQLEMKIPYAFRTEENSTAPLATQTNLDTRSVDGQGLGDIEFGLRYQLNQPQSGPYYIAGLRVKTDTGTDPFEVSRDPDTQLPNELATGSGFWGVQANISALFPSDPAVFYGGLSYLWNIAREIGTVNGIDYGKFDPGDAYGFNFGMGIALNRKTSLSLGYDHSILTKNKRDETVLPDQVTLHVGMLQLGYSYQLTEKRTINLSLGIGATESAPNVQLTLKVPFTL